LAQLPADTLSRGATPTDWLELLKQHARFTAVAPVEALNALHQLLPDMKSRERALALSAAVMMIEPTLSNPRSEIIEFLIDTLGVDPAKVMDLANGLTHNLQSPTAAVAASPKRRTPARKKAG
jgi:hypothetical protein